MDIQVIFYTLASLFMLLGIMIMVAIIYFLWKMERGAKNMCTFFAEKKNEMAGLVGTGILALVFKKIREHFKKE